MCESELLRRTVGNEVRGPRSSVRDRLQTRDHSPGPEGGQSVALAAPVGLRWGLRG